MSAAEKARRNLLAIEISQDELACRIAEKCMGVRRPAHLSARDALAMLESHRPDIIDAWRAAADEAVAYFHECVNAARQPS